MFFFNFSIKKAHKLLRSKTQVFFVSDTFSHHISIICYIIFVRENDLEILTLSFGLMHSLASGSRVHMDGSLHNKTIVKQFSNVLSY